MSKYNVGHSLLFTYVHIHSYYKLFLYSDVCLCVMLDSISCSFHIRIISYYRLFIYFNLCLYVMLDSLSWFLYIHVLSYYKLFLHINLCLCVKFDSLSCSFTPIPFLTTGCSFTLICVQMLCCKVSRLHLCTYSFVLQPGCSFTLICVQV